MKRDQFEHGERDPTHAAGKLYKMSVLKTLGPKTYYIEDVNFDIFLKCCKLHLDSLLIEKVLQAKLQMSKNSFSEKCEIMRGRFLRMAPAYFPPGPAIGERQIYNTDKFVMS